MLGTTHSFLELFLPFFDFILGIFIHLAAHGLFSFIVPSDMDRYDPEFFLELIK